LSIHVVCQCNLIDVDVDLLDTGFLDLADKIFPCGVVRNCDSVLASLPTKFLSVVSYVGSNMTYMFEVHILKGKPEQ
jgi:hypothetical protein